MRDKVTRGKEGKRERNGGEDPGVPTEGGGLSFDIWAGASEFHSPQLKRPVCLLSQGRFEEPVRPYSGSDADLSAVVAVAIL